MSARSGPPRRPIMHLLSGASVPTLWRLLKRHGYSSRHLGQIVLLFLTAAALTPFTALERLRVARRVRTVRLDPPPLLIVGHWRSGTTYLHNLMSRDPQFAFPTLSDTVRPSLFFPGPAEWMTRLVLKASLPAVRPMDDVPMRLDLPQEDELALASLGAPSFFNGFYFPRDLAEIFRREVLFEGLDEASRQHWRRCLLYYLAKLAVLRPGRRLLLKNPAHSARLAEVTALFPEVNIIHIHRDPFDVFLSMRRLFRGMLAMVTLQDASEVAVDAHILETYPLIMDRLHEDLGRRPAGSHVTVRYADLVDRPLETLASIYRDLGLGGFEAARPAIERFLAQTPVTPASSEPLDADLARQIGERWQRQIERLGYRCC